MKQLASLYRAVATTLLLGMCCLPLPAQPITYQGMLKELGVPAQGTYDFLFRLYPVATGGTPLGTLSAEEVSVVNGVFTRELDFGTVWNGEDRYLQAEVRPGNSTGDYTVLSPRVRVNYTPYSILSLNALWAQSVPWSGITGIPGSFPPGGTAGGDLTGDYPNPTVARIRGRSISTAAPSSGQVLKWNGSQWAPGSDAGSNVVAFVHTVTSAGIADPDRYITYIDRPSINGKPNAIVIITPRYGGAGAPDFAGAVGVFYDDFLNSNNRWAIYYLDLTSEMEEGLRFNVLVFQP